METLILFIISVGFVLPILLILRGFVFTKLWVWFVAPIFGCRPLTKELGLSAAAAQTIIPLAN